MPKISMMSFMDGPTEVDADGGGTVIHSGVEGVG